MIIFIFTSQVHTCEERQRSLQNDDVHHSAAEVKPFFFHSIIIHSAANANLLLSLFSVITVGLRPDGTLDPHHAAILFRDSRGVSLNSTRKALPLLGYSRDTFVILLSSQFLSFETRSSVWMKAINNSSASMLESLNGHICNVFDRAECEDMNHDWQDTI